MITPTTPLPEAPNRTQGPANYSAIADAFFSALVTFQAQQNAQANEVDARVTEAVTAADAIADFQNRYLGPFAADPLTGFGGSPLTIGLLYFKTTAPQEVRVYTSAGWKGVGSYTTGSIDVTGYIRPAVYLGTQSTFKNPPAASLLINQFTSFIVDTNRSTQLSFVYNPTTMGAMDSLEFRIDLIHRAGSMVMFPTNLRWAGGGMAPDWGKPMFEPGSRSLINVYSSDSGVSWLAEAAILNASADNAPSIT